MPHPTSPKLPQSCCPFRITLLASHCHNNAPPTRSITVLTQPQPCKQCNAHYRLGAAQGLLQSVHALLDGSLFLHASMIRFTLPGTKVQAPIRDRHIQRATEHARLDMRWHVIVACSQTYKP